MIDDLIKIDPGFGSDLAEGDVRSKKGTASAQSRRVRYHAHSGPTPIGLRIVPQYDT